MASHPALPLSRLSGKTLGEGGRCLRELPAWHHQGHCSQWERQGFGRREGPGPSGAGQSPFLPCLLLLNQPLPLEPPLPLERNPPCWQPLLMSKPG